MTTRVGAIVLVFACANAEAAEWWEQKTPCPEGAKLEGAPKAGDVRCVKDGKLHGRRTEWWAAGGKLAEDSSWRDGEPDGEWTRWYQDGTLAVKSRWKKGLLHGELVEHDVWGNVLRQGRFEDGLEHGDWKLFWPGGKPRAAGKYERGLRAGAWSFWEADGTEIPDVAATAAVKDRWWKAKGACPPGTQLEDGFEAGDDPPVVQCTAGGVPHGPSTRWYSGLEMDEGGHYSGRHTPEMEEQGTYRMGERHGAWTGWHENGKKAWMGSFLDGHPHGKWTFWSEKGKKLGAVELDGTKGWSETLDPGFAEKGDAGCPAGAKLVAREDVGMAGCELPGGQKYGPSASGSGDNLVITTYQLERHGPALERGERGSYRRDARAGAWRRTRASDGTDGYYMDGRKAHRAVVYSQGRRWSEEAHSHEAQQFTSTFWDEGRLRKQERWIRGKLAVRIEYDKDGKATDSTQPPSSAKGSGWWKKPRCPEGAMFIGGPGPAGVAYCEREDGRYHGPYTRWFASGDLSEEGTYVDGKRDGVWTWWYTSGAVLEQSSWKAGVRHGHFVERGPDGAVRREGDFQDGLRHGTWASSWGKGSYDRGVRAAGWIDLRESKELADLPSAATPAADWWKQDGACPAGTTLADEGGEIFCSTPGGVRHGPYARLAKKKRAVALGVMRFGVPHGAWVGFDAKGKKAWAGSYLDGVPDGVWTSWDAKGKETTVTLDARAWPGEAAWEWWKTGCPAGTKLEGSLKKGAISCRFLDGILHGPVAEKDEEGEISVGVRHGELKVGVWRTYVDGKLRSESTFLDGKQDGWARSGLILRQYETRWSMNEPYGRDTRYAGMRVVEEGVRLGQSRWVGRAATLDEEGRISVLYQHDYPNAPYAIPYEDGKPIVK
jgi:antitoxin component YwqK of YwqJK toxin-antitoxin module